MQMYADDIVVVCRDLNELYRSKTILKKWCVTSGMSINVEKSGVLITEPRRRREKEVMPLWQDYQVVDTYKYLGVEIEGTGSLRSFMTRVKEKLNKYRWSLNTLRRLGGENVRRSLCEIYCIPILRMGYVSASLTAGYRR